MKHNTDPFRLDGMTALISGGGSGIGFAIARAFAASGARVILCGRRKEALDTAVHEIGSSALAEQCEITDAAAVQSMVERVTRKAGPIDVLVNNAGTHLKKLAEDTLETEIRQV